MGEKVIYSWKSDTIHTCHPLKTSTRLVKLSTERIAPKPEINNSRNNCVRKNIHFPLFIPLPTQYMPSSIFLEYIFVCRQLISVLLQTIYYWYYIIRRFRTAITCNFQWTNEKNNTLKSEGFLIHLGPVLHNSVVKCLTCNPEVLDSSHTGYSGFFVRVSLGEILQSPSLVLVKPRKDMNNVSCHSDMM